MYLICYVSDSDRVDKKSLTPSHTAPVERSNDESKCKSALFTCTDLLINELLIGDLLLINSASAAYMRDSVLAYYTA